MSSSVTIHPLSASVGHPVHRKSPSWLCCLKKASKLGEKLKIHKGQEKRRLPTSSKSPLLNGFDVFGEQSRSSEFGQNESSPASVQTRRVKKVPRAAKVGQDWVLPSSEKASIHDTATHASAFRSEARPSSVKGGNEMETLKAIIYEEGYTIEDIAKLLRISDSNYALKILTNQLRYTEGENIELLRVRIDYAMAIMTTRKAVTLEEISAVSKIPTHKWVAHLPSPSSPVLGPLQFDCRFFESTASFLTNEQEFSPWIQSVFVITMNNSVPVRAQCTFDTGNYQGNIASRAFLLEVLGYSESMFELLAPGEKAGGIDASGQTLIPLGAVSLTWYAGRSTRIFRNVRFLVSPHHHYELIVGAPFIEANGLLGAPNFMITERKSEFSCRESSGTVPRALVSDSFQHSDDTDEPNQGGITGISFSHNEQIEKTEIKSHINDVSTPDHSDACLQSALSNSPESNTDAELPFRCNKDAHVTESSDAPSAPKVEQNAAITSAIFDITTSLASFAFPYVLSNFEAHFTQGMGQSRGVTTSGNSTKANLNAKDNGKQQQNTKRRRTSKTGAYKKAENGDGEDGDGDDGDGDGDEDESRDEVKNGPSHRIPGGWGCIFHIQYPDWYHPQNLCLSPKSRQKFNLCATKSFRRLDELTNHILDVHGLPEFVCLRCRAEFSSQEHHYDHSLSCDRKAFRNIKFGIDQKMRHDLTSLPKKPRDQTFLERWHTVFNIIFPSEIPPSPYFEEGAKRFGKYNVYLKDALPGLTRKYLERFTETMSLGAELRQYIQSVLDRLIENSFPDILREASEGFRSLELAGRPVLLHNGPAPPKASSPERLSTSPLSENWDQIPAPDFAQIPAMSFVEASPSPVSVSRNEGREVYEADGTQDHLSARSSTAEKISPGFKTFPRDREQIPSPDFAQDSMNFPLEMQGSERAAFEFQTAWQAIELGETFEFGEWEGENCFQ